MKPQEQPILHLSKHTGMVVAFQNVRYKFTGPPEQLHAAYQKIQRHCLLFGWWSAFSLFIINPLVILLNAYNWYSYKKKFRTYAQAQGIPQSPIS